MNNGVGFSLFECIIVVALISCVVTIGFIGNSFLQESRVQTEIDLLYQVARYLQQRAITTHTVQYLHFDVAHQCYEFNDTVHALASGVCFGCAAGVFGPPSLAHKEVANVCTFSDNKIAFWPDGIIKAGTIYLTDARKWYTYALSSGVGSVSFLRTYCYKQKEWLCRS